MQDGVSVEKTYGKRLADCKMVSAALLCCNRERSWVLKSDITPCGSDFLHTAPRCTHDRKAKWIMCLCVSGTRKSFAHLVGVSLGSGWSLLLLSCKYWLGSLVMCPTWLVTTVTPTPLQLAERNWNFAKCLWNNNNLGTELDALSSASVHQCTSLSAAPCVSSAVITTKNSISTMRVKLGFVHSVHYLVRHHICLQTVLSKRGFIICM